MDMGCTPKTKACGEPDAGCGDVNFNTKFPPLDSDASPVWSNNPLEREVFLYNSGLYSTCSEVEAFEMERQRQFRQMTDHRQKKTYSCGESSIFYFDGITSESELEDLCSLSAGLIEIFPELKARSIAYTGIASGAAALGLGGVTLSIMPKSEHIRLGRYVHEFGHNVYSLKFGIEKDANLEKLLLASWYHRNYMIIKDATYIHPDLTFDVHGHINSSDELFASTFFSYYYEADQFAEFIMDPGTPAAMKSFGATMWSYMRDKIFGGKVFTSSGVDPFPEASYERYVANIDFDAHEIIIQKFKEYDFNGMELGYVVGYLDVSRGLRSLPGFLEDLASGKVSSGIRSLIRELASKDFDALIVTAESLLKDGILSAGARLELINIIGKRFGSQEMRVIDLLINILKTSNCEKERKFIICLIRDHVQTYEYWRSIGSDVFLTDEYLKDLRRLLEQY